MTSTYPRTETAVITGPFTLGGNLRSADLRVRALAGLGEARVTVNAVGPRANEMIEATRVILDGTRLDIYVPQMRHFLSLGTRLWLDADVPAMTSVELEASSGDIGLEGAYGNVRVRSSSGSIRLAKADQASLSAASGSISLDEGKIADISVSSGSVEVGDVDDLSVSASSGSIRAGSIAVKARLASQSGSVKAQSIRGEGLLESTSGSVVVEQALGVLRATAVSGSVKIRSFAEGRLEAKTVSGSIRVGIPEGTAVQADVQATTGSIRTDLESVAGAEGYDRTAVIVGRSVSGSIKLSRAL